MTQLVPHQYKPFNHHVGDMPLIIYPIKNVGDIHALVADTDAIKHHLDELYKIQEDDLGRGQFHIVFVWTLRGLLMTDVWVHQKNMIDLDVGGEIVLERCLVFKGYEQYEPIGIASDNTLVTIGREQEHRWSFDNINDYLDRAKSMPNFPEGFAPKEDY